MGALLTKGQVAELAGKSTKWVDRKREELQPAEGPAGRNGQPIPLYDVAALPADVQQKWARAEKRQKVVELPGTPSGQLALALTTPVGPNLSQEDLAEANRRFGVIEPLIDQEKYGLLYAQYPRMSQVMEYLAKAHGVKVRTIYRWLDLWRDGGLPALVRRDRSDKGTSKAMNDAARALLLKLAVPQRGMYGALPIREMWRVYEEERAWREGHAAKALTHDYEQSRYAQYLDMDGRLLPAAQLPKVSYECFRTWFNRIPEMIRSMGREGEDSYRTYQEIISHRDLTAIDPMDWVVFDHRVLDIFCLVRERGGWKLARPWLTASIDMRTRKWLAWAVVETPSSDSIATVLKRLFINHGLPKELYWDNGKDFRCEWFEGKKRETRQEGRIAELDTTWRGVLGTLDIRVRHAIAYNARAKIIEPNFNRISNVDRQLPEWCGNKPGARPERFADLLKQHEAWVEGKADLTPFRTIEQVAALYSRAIHELNERPLEGEGMRKVTPTGHGWMCPNEAWELLIPRVARRSVPVDVLHMCFQKRKELTVRNGEIQTTHAGQPYFYRLSDNSLGLQMLNGRTVEFAYDPLDLGEGAVYYEGRFFGLVSCVALRRMGEQAFVQDERDRRAARREVKKAIEAVGRMAPAPTIEERLARREEARPAREEVRVELPVAIAGPVAEATAAAIEERHFDFEAVQADQVPGTEPPAQNEEEEFRFFQN
ncbi:MAG TPA: transposase [Bryobacteraceae bacterium]|nr:transposase [Bryobacteraceae bacterium]